MNVNHRSVISASMVLSTLLMLAGSVSAQQHLPTYRTPTKPTQHASVKPANQTPAKPVAQKPVAQASHGEVIAAPVSDCGCGSCQGGSCSSNCGSCGFDICGGSCSGGCGLPNLFCGGRNCEPDYWVRAEALSWWFNGFNTPALVTTSPAGTARDDAGVVSFPGTSVLLGGSIGDDANAGGRYAIGTWLDPCRTIGLEFNYFHAETDGDDFIADATTASIVARPFFNVTTGQDDAELIVFPNVVTGSIRIHADTEFSGGELLIQRPIGTCGPCNMIGLFGYRFQHLEDSLQFVQATTSIDTGSPIEPGTTFDLQDNFRTENEFHGAEIGFLAEICRCNNVTMELLAKFAIGNTRSRAFVSGTTTIDTPSGGPATNDGALLALPSNSGTFEADDFTIVPEIALRMNYQLGCNWQLQFGYTFIYWSNVARPGDQIDTRLNLTQLPPGPQAGANLPVFNMVTDDFWAQGLNLGLQYDF